MSNDIGNNNGGAVAGSFNFSAQLPNGKSLTFSGYILAGESVADVNLKLDFASQAVERQRMIAEIPELEAKLDQTILAREQTEVILAEMKRHDKLSSAQKQEVNTRGVNLAMLDKQIARGREAIDRAKAKAANAGS